MGNKEFNTIFYKRNGEKIKLVMSSDEFVDVSRLCGLMKRFKSVNIEYFIKINGMMIDVQNLIILRRDNKYYYV